MSDKYGEIFNDKPRFRAVREWGNKWTLFDFETGQQIVKKSTDRASVEDGAEKLNHQAKGEKDLTKLRAIIGLKAR